MPAFAFDAKSLVPDLSRASMFVSADFQDQDNGFRGEKRGTGHFIDLRAGANLDLLYLKGGVGGHFTGENTFDPVRYDIGAGIQKTMGVAYARAGGLYRVNVGGSEDIEATVALGANTEWVNIGGQTWYAFKANDPNRERSFYSEINADANLLDVATVSVGAGGYGAAVNHWTADVSKSFEAPYGASLTLYFGTTLPTADGSKWLPDFDGGFEHVGANLEWAIGSG